jgi:hypothetical protein
VGEENGAAERDQQDRHFWLALSRHKSHLEIVCRNILSCLLAVDSLDLVIDFCGVDRQADQAMPAVCCNLDILFQFEGSYCMQESRDHSQSCVLSGIVSIHDE